MENNENKMSMCEAIISGMVNSVLEEERGKARRCRVVYDDPEDDGEICQQQIADFVSGMRETLDEFLDRDYERDDKELYECDEPVTCDADDYNDDGFEHRYEAQNACRKALDSAIDDISSEYERARDELIDAAWMYYGGGNGGFVENANRFYEAFSDSCRTMLDIYTSGTTKKYLNEKTDEFLAGLTEEKGMVLVRKLFDKTFEELVEKHFTSAEKKIASIKELFGECEIEEDGDEYYFSIDEACDMLCERYNDLLEKEADDFPEDVLAYFTDLNREFFGVVTDWLDNLK